ncbi:MAG: hypothetical protein AAF633_27060 [Chloroflexota bacterium]
MDLISLFEIFKRRWLYMVIPAAIVLVLAIVTAEEAVVPAPTYNVGVRFLVAPPLIDEEEPSDAVNEQEERYYQWLTSEYVVNGVADWVNSIGFAELVAAEMANNGVELDPLTIFNSTSADAIRSRLTLVMNYGDEPTLAVMMDAAIFVVETQNEFGIPHLTGGEPAVVTLLDRPVINAVAPPIGNQLDLPLRIALALVVGIVVGLLAHYFDPIIRAPEDVTRSGLSLLSEGVTTDARQLRASMLLQTPEPQVVVVSGLDKQTDVSQTTADLAKALANSGRSVVLVDADLSQPALHQVLGKSNQSGMAAVLASGSTLELEDADGIQFLAAGQAGEKANDLISGPHLSKLIEQLRSMAENVIIKSAPVSASMDSRLLAAQADLALIGVQAGRSKRTHLKGVSSQIDMVEKPIKGFLF